MLIVIESRDPEHLPTAQGGSRIAAEAFHSRAPNSADVEPVWGTGWKGWGQPKEIFRPSETARF